MISTFLAVVLATGVAQSDAAPKSSAAVDGIWTVVAMEVNGRPSTLTEKDAGLAIRNSTLTLPGIASMHGVIRIELSPKGVLRAIPAARGTGNRRDTSDNETGMIGSASGVYVRTADYLVMTIGDPATATATGTGVGADARPAGDPASPPAVEKPQPTVGTPPVSIVLKRSTGADAPPSTAAAPPLPGPVADAAPAVTAQPPQRISTMMGTDVTLSDGTSAGKVEDFVYSNGALDYALLNSGGTFNAVPWNALNWNATTGLASIPLTRAQFATVPTFGANDLNAFLQNPAFFTRVQNTFIGFRDINGNPVFNSIGMNTLTDRGQTQNQSGTQPVNQTGNRPITQPGTRPGIPPGTNTGTPGVPPGGKAVPGGTDPNTITGNPAPPAGQPPAAQPKGQPPTGQPKGVPPTGQPKGQPKGGQPKPPGGE